LNALLYYRELTIAEACRLQGNKLRQEEYLRLAQIRKAAIRKYGCGSKHSFYTDYDFASRQTTPSLSHAAIYPLYFRIANGKEVKKVHRKVKKAFLKPGGLVTTLTKTKQQWDYPNGWAPLPWIGIKGLQNYHLKNTADKAATNWIEVNKRVYRILAKC
jgi:alpha,alpha-trehalase